MKISFEINFWKWLCHFAYRRWAGDAKVKPVGIPGNRDPESICKAYFPKKRTDTSEDWGDCESDGHYLCKGCVHLSPEARQHL